MIPSKETMNCDINLAKDHLAHLLCVEKAVTEIKMTVSSSGEDKYLWYKFMVHHSLYL